MFRLANGGVGTENDDIAAKRGADTGRSCPVERVELGPRRVGMQVRYIFGRDEAELVASCQLRAQHFRERGSKPPFRWCR